MARGDRRLRVTIGRKPFEVSAVLSRHSILIRDDLRYNVEIPFATLTGWMTADQLHEFMRHALREAVARGEQERRKIAAATKKRIKERDGLRCHYCRETGNERVGPGNRPWHIDHVNPKINGGSDDDDNLVLACEACNLAKSDREYDEFVSSLPPLRLVADVGS